MSIHGVLSESSVSHHGGLTHGSGREVEGKWKGSGRRVVTSHHLVTSVTRDLAPVVAPSPVAAPDEMMSLAAIEHLDFEPDWHCESARHHSGRSHGGPGWALVTQSCPACAGHSTQGVICRSWWDAKCRSKARCDLCGHISTMADFVRIAAVLA